MENEIGGRLSRQDFLNQKTLPWYFYFDYMVTQDRFYGWIFVLPVSIIYIFTRPADHLKKAGVFFIFIFFGISILLALSRTKLEWYDAPLYPLMAAIIGISFCQFFNQTGNKYIVLALFGGVFVVSYYKVVYNNMDTDGTSLRSFYKLVRHNGHGKDSIHVINSDPNYPLYFYAVKDCLDGYYSDVVTHVDSSLHVGSYIVTEKYERDIDVNRTFVLKPILRYKECNYYQIAGIK